MKRNLARRNHNAQYGLTDAHRRQIAAHVFAMLREEVRISAERQGRKQ